MCDYSLESYKSRAAVDGEDLVVKHFPSGSKGLVEARSDRAESLFDCAVCCKDGVEMTLSLHGSVFTRIVNAAAGITVGARPKDDETEEFDGEIPVRFHTLKSGVCPAFPRQGWYIHTYKDGFILPNGRFLLLQDVLAGTRAIVTKALPIEIAEAAKGEKAFKPEDEIKPIETRVPHRRRLARMLLRRD